MQAENSAWRYFRSNTLNPVKPRSRKTGRRSRPTRFLKLQLALSAAIRRRAASEDIAYQIDDVADVKSTVIIHISPPRMYGGKPPLNI